VLIAEMLLLVALNDKGHVPVARPEMALAVLFSLLGDRVEWDRVPFLSVPLLAA
jgi:hypothetical protein